MGFMPSQDRTKAVVIGQGYVGLPVAMAAVQAGYFVAGVDLDARKVSELAMGRSSVEDIPDEAIRRALDNKSYIPTDDYEFARDFSIAVITVPTPLRDGEPDLSYIEAAGSSLAGLVTAGCTVILESTTYPGTTEELLVPILEAGSSLRAGIDFYVGYSPERIDPGNKNWNLLNTPKVVSGVNQISLEKVENFYQSLSIKTVPVSGTREAELTKLLENTFRHVNIALVNELAMFSRHLNVDIWEAIDAATTKPFGFMRFTPGPGVGGHCLPIDPSYLSWAIKDKTGTDFRFVSLANEVNDFMPRFVVERAKELLQKNGTEIAGSTMVLLGLAYKPDTGDIRESPSVVVAELLREAGVELFGIDQHVSQDLWPIGVAAAKKEDLSRFDLAILLTNHSGDDFEWALESSRVILDTRNCLNRKNVERL